MRTKKLKYRFIIVLILVSIFIGYSCIEPTFAQGTENIAEIWQAQRTKLEKHEYTDDLGQTHKVLLLVIHEPARLTAKFTNKMALDLTVLFFCNSIPQAYEDCDELEVYIYKEEHTLNTKVNIKDALYANTCYTASNALIEQLQKRNTYNFESYFNKTMVSDSTINRITSHVEKSYNEINTSEGFIIDGYSVSKQGTQLRYHVNTVDTAVECILEYFPTDKNLKNLYFTPSSGLFIEDTLKTK